MFRTKARSNKEDKKKNSFTYFDKRVSQIPSGFEEYMEH